MKTSEVKAETLPRTDTPLAVAYTFGLKPYDAAELFFDLSHFRQWLRIQTAKRK
jgi:hypothetical protein